LVLTEAKAPKNGYVYVYLSNESTTPVYFDNLKVIHERGQIVAEDHYYAYGLKIAAISSKALSSSLNPSIAKYGYQGSYAEEVTEFELNYNEFALRTYDPQLGRFTTPDPYNEFASPYVGMGADAANFTDPDGGSVLSAITGTTNAFVNIAATTISGALVGAIVGLAAGDGEKGAYIGAAVGLGMGIGFSMSAQVMKSAAETLLAVGTQVAAAAGSTPPPVVNASNVDEIKTLHIEKEHYSNSASTSNQSNAEKETFTLINKGMYHAAVARIFEAFPNEMSPTVEYYEYYTQPKNGGHRTYPRAKNNTLSSYTIFGEDVLDYFAWGISSFGNLVRTIFHEINHVRINAKTIKTIEGSKAEREFLSYSAQYSNTTLPKYNTKLKAEKKMIENDRANFKTYFESLSDNLKNFYRKQYESTLKIMDNLLNEK
jgi:RHS repeat-associated protein